VGRPTGSEIDGIIDPGASKGYVLGFCFGFTNIVVIDLPPLEAPERQLHSGLTDY
jgi:hypothetical protein